MKEYEVRSMDLAPEGHKKIEWVRNNMPILRMLEDEFKRDKPFAGVKISLSIHMEAKTAYLCRVLALGGAELAATGSNSLSTQDDVAAALADSGVRVFAVHGVSQEDYERHLEMTLEHRPNIIIDDGGDLVSLVHTKRPDLAEEVWGGCEETTTGILRLKAMEREGALRFPMLAVNNARCKHLFDNRYGTGQSVWDSLMRNTNLIVAGKQVVVAGYGWCGKGIAARASALGARVIVTEIDPVAAMEAVMDGFEVMPMDRAAERGDVFITATGCRSVIRGEHMGRMKDRAILANAGHFNVEIDMEELEREAVEKRELRKNVTGYRLPEGNWVCVLAEGRLVNIAAADGHPAEIMDLSFAVQLQAALYLMEHRGRLEKKVTDVSAEIDRRIGRWQLAAWGTDIDSLTEEQALYLKSWNF
ncbi:MAG: adenosylhomocysteinase [Bacillota bacterium]|nr:adenosylhomocysteinase [Bacillota bacterium]